MIKSFLLLACLISAFAIAQDISLTVENWIFIVGNSAHPVLRKGASCPTTAVCEKTISGSILVPNNFRPVGDGVDIVYDRRFSANTNVSSYSPTDDVGYILVHYLSTGALQFAESTHDFYNITAAVFIYDDAKSLITYIIKLRWLSNAASTVFYGFVFRMTPIEPPVCNITCQNRKVDPRTGEDMCECCGPVCLIFCPNGNVLDNHGCPTCQCKPATNLTLVIYDDRLQLGAGNYLFTGNGPNTGATIDLQSTDSPHSGTNDIKIRLDSYSGGGDQFTIYFFGNGNASGYRGIPLNNYSTVQFWAKTNRNLIVSTNFGGGATDTGFKNFGDLHLSTEWTFFEFDIVRPNKALINTILWIVLGQQQNPGLQWQDVTLWLDDIVLTGSFTTGVSDCDYSSGYYTLRDVAKCQLVTFHCTNELVMFNNGCGCGCKPAGLDI